MHIIHCFGNSLEAILTLAIFNFYYDIRNKFDKNMIKFTFLVTMSFMMRCTSIIGWIPLVIYKMYQNKGIKVFVISGIVVAIPSFLLFILGDSLYYGQFTFVPFNFIYKNIIEDISSSFGV